MLLVWIPHLGYPGPRLYWRAFQVLMYFFHFSFYLRLHLQHMDFPQLGAG